MTNEALLQQAKDQVAKKADYKGCTDWTSFKSRMNNDGYEMQPYHDEASLLAIQSAREEGKKAIEELGTIGHDPKNPMWDALPDSAEAVNAAYANAWNKFRELAIEKLTAPGR